MKHLPRLHLNGLRALEATGRLGSLQKAAQELGVTVGAVSQHVLRAEAQLGRPVFDRIGRSLVPNALGRQMLPRLSAGFQTLDEAMALAFESPQNVLTISVAPVFASKWLVPRLSRYSAAHPGIQVRLDASMALANPNMSDIDLCIRVGDGDWPNLRKEFLLAQEIFPVCAPELADRLKRPQDLKTVPIVLDARSNLKWNQWLALHGMDESELTQGNSFTDAALALDAAIAGQGVLLAWQTLAHSALQTGALVAPFPGRARTEFGYWLITALNRQEEAKITGFKRWIREELAETARAFA